MKIDEMKLHRMLYFAQRESFVLKDAPLFEAVFHGWMYGPVVKEVREMYASGSFVPVSDPSSLEELGPVMENVFARYGEKDRWSLSRLSRGELSWQNSRIGIGVNDSSDNPVRNEDIRKDAERIRMRMSFLASLGLPGRKG